MEIRVYFNYYKQL